MAATIYTPETVEKFLAALAATARVDLACKAAGVGRSAMYKWRALHEDFAKKWAAAQEEGTSILEDEATRRAIEGDADGTTKKSDLLLIFLLRARRPEVYRDNASVRLAGPNDGAIQINESDRANRIGSLLALAAKRKAAQDELGDLA